MPGMNNLRDEKTFWMFLLSSRNAQPEKNHIRDVGFGLYCLEKAGIDKNDIILVIDCTPPDQVESVLKEFTNQTYVIHSSSELGKLIEGNVDYKNMVLFVFGHGSQSGIASNPKDISPYKLYSSIKQSKSLKTATVYLGQCYAGLFNHMNAQACRNDDGTSSPGC